MLSSHIARAVSLIACGSIFGIAGCAASADSDIGTVESALDLESTDTCPAGNWESDDGDIAGQSFRSKDALYIDPFLYAANCHDRRFYQTTNGETYYAALCPAGEVNEGGQLNNELHDSVKTRIAGYTMFVQDPLNPSLAAKAAEKADYGIVKKTSVCTNVAPKNEIWVAWNTNIDTQRASWCWQKKGAACANDIREYPQPTCSTCQPTRIANLFGGGQVLPSVAGRPE